MVEFFPISLERVGPWSSYTVMPEVDLRISPHLFSKQNLHAGSDC